MSNQNPQEVSAQTTKPALSETEILAAATNSPELSPDEFQLGEHTFKVVHLSYDDYLQFLAHLQPFLDAVVSKLAEKANLSIPGIDTGNSLELPMLVRFCGENLPEMVRIICKQTMPNITVQQVKEWGRTPFNLASIVLKQVAKNHMIKDFADFFARIAPLLKSVR